MDVSEIFKEAFHYPINNYKNWGKIAVVFLLIGIFNKILTIKPGAISGVLSLISLILAIIGIGIGIQITRETINRKDEIPMIDPINNFIDGIKSLILSFIYMLIPIILTVIIALITGVFVQLSGMVFDVAINGSEALSSFFTASILTSIFVTLLISIILIVLFSLLSTIGQARFAETRTLMRGLDVGEVFNKISAIGWGKYIIYILILFIIIFVIALISLIIMSIPYVGGIIKTTVFDSFMTIFIARATGLIYLEG